MGLPFHGVYDIAIVPMGDIDMVMLNRVKDMLSSSLTVPVRVLPPEGRPHYAFDMGRRQFHSTRILKQLLETPAGDSLKIVGVVDVDLFVPILTFVFGEAQLGGRVAVVSTARLKQEFYGLPPNESLTELRLVKECAHEIGHTFGLTHCRSSRCVMYLSNTIRDVDAKGEKLCEKCTDELNERVKTQET